MYKRLAHLLLALGALITVAGCGSRLFPDAAPASDTPTAVANVLATRDDSIPTPPPIITLEPSATALIPPATAVATAPPAATATHAAASTAAGFCCLRFADGPDALPADSFPAGTEIVYALWDYSDLQASDRIRRIWFRDDLIWLTREENWDWDNYGSEGTVRDLSVFDHEGSGLPPATYRLQLYLNDALQAEGRFVIPPGAQ